MNSKRFFGLTITLAVATFVVSALAQPPNKPADNWDTSPLRELPGRYPQNDLFGSPKPSGDPALQRLWSEEQSLAGDANKLTQQFEAADTDAKRDAIKAKLREVLGKQFDARQKRHGLEIEALEAKVKKLKEIVKKRQEGREDIITRRLEQVVRDSQGLGW